MNLKQLAVCCIACGLSITTYANDYTVYKSVGANGVPRFSQIPPNNMAGVEVLQFSSDGRISTPKEVVEESSDQTNHQQNELSELAQRVNELQERENAQRCQSLKNSLANMNMGGRIYEMGSDGNRVYLNEQQVEERRQRAQQAIAQFCQ